MEDFGFDFGPIPGFTTFDLADGYEHLGNGLSVISFLFRNVLALRFLAILGATATIAYSVIGGPEIAWISVFWQSLVVIINVVWSIKLLQERTGLNFSEEEKELYQALFAHLNPVEYMKLLRVGIWEKYSAGEVLATRGEPLDNVLLIYSGTADVALADGGRRKLKDGTFIGEMSFIAGTNPTATVTSETAMRCLTFPKDALRELLTRSPAIKSGLEAAFAQDLTTKLARDLENQHVAMGARGSQEA
ncbi:MAG: cyclic nucleotide-binding domain-containing protein [Alphaproteobacteria bacterium]